MYERAGRNSTDAAAGSPLRRALPRLRRRRARAVRRRRPRHMALMSGRVDSWDILQIAAAWSGTRLVLGLSGELDFCSAPQLTQALDEAAARTPAEVLLDLECLSFIDAAGIRAIVRGAEMFGSRLVLHHTPRHVMRLFALVGVDERLTFGRECSEG